MPKLEPWAFFCLRINMKKLILPCLALSFFITACSIKHNDESSTKAYQIKENGCDTGYHTFSTDSDSDTLNQYCSALEDDAANNGCAETTRRTTFEAACPGVWTPR
jgi:hypothetical protein